MHDRSHDSGQPCEADPEQPASLACAVHFTTADDEVVIYDERIHTSWISSTDAVSLDSVR